MTYAELEEIERGARAATVYGVEQPPTPLRRQIVNGLVGAAVLLVAAIVVLCYVIWRAR